MNTTDTTAGHPEYTASATAWLDRDGDVQARRGIIVQCPTVDHEHTDRLELRSVLHEDPEVGLAWVVTAHGPRAIDAMEAALQAASALAVLLTDPAFGRR
jgi:hypothetical protein